MKNILPILSLALLALVGCNRQAEAPLYDASTRHASLLQMQTLAEHRTLCRIGNPWISGQTVIQYLLVDAADTLFSEGDLTQVTERFGQVQLLRTPLHSQALTSSCHAWLLAQLEALDGVSVMCDAGYVIDSAMQRLLQSGRVRDGGSSMSPNIEVLLAAGCDAIWISPFENSGFRNRNDRYGIPEIYCADYMENSPLGRAEWMRFYGRLVGRGAEADSLFRIIEHSYDSIAQRIDSLTAGNIHRRRLLAELPTSGTWHVPGGCSTMGQMYMDAGFDYPWSQDTHAGSLTLAPEAVFHKDRDAEVWVFKYYAPDASLSCQQLQSLHPLIRDIRAFQERQLFGCNTATSNYFDVTPFRPDLLLRELADIAQSRTDSLLFFHILPAN